MYCRNIGCAVETKKAMLVLAMPREGVKMNHLVESWNRKLQEDVLGDVQKRTGGRMWRQI